MFCYVLFLPIRAHSPVPKKAKNTVQAFRMMKIIIIIIIIIITIIIIINNNGLTSSSSTLWSRVLAGQQQTLPVVSVRKNSLVVALVMRGMCTSWWLDPSPDPCTTSPRDSLVLCSMIGPEGTRDVSELLLVGAIFFFGDGWNIGGRFPATTQA